MEISGDIKLINDWLAKQGKNPQGRPLFRLVWSNNETEIRYGTFNDFKGDIFLRSVTETRRVLKYNYINERWILEMWLPVSNPELPASQYEGTWEPLFVFEGKDNCYLQPTMKTVQFLIEQSRQPKKKSTPAELAEEDQRKFDKEIQDFMDQIDVSPISNALHMGEGVGYTKALEN